MRIRPWSAAAPLLALAALGLRSKLRRREGRPGPRQLRERRRLNWHAWINQHVWVKPFSDLPFTPVLTCEPRCSALMHRFDWMVIPESSYIEKKRCETVEGKPWEDVPLHKDPKAVWVAPHGLERLLEFAEEHFDSSRADRMVVFLGTEMPLSAAFGRDDPERRDSVAKLRKFFSRISFQTKDMSLEHVHLAPMGLCWGYMTMVLGELDKEGRGWAELLRALSGRGSEKTRGVLASWGSVAAWLDKDSTLQRAARLLPTGRLYQPSNSSLLAIISGHSSRKNLRAWVNTSQARAAGVEYRSLEPLEWWTELAKYRFLLAAPGAAIQTAKVLEALLVKTVPIVQRFSFNLFEELAERGFPIAITYRWEEVTPENLDRWWRSLSPRLESFRRNCLTTDGWWRMYTGAVERCE